MESVTPFEPRALSRSVGFRHEISGVPRAGAPQHAPGTATYTLLGPRDPEGLPVVPRNRLAGGGPAACWTHPIPMNTKYTRRLLR